MDYASSQASPGVESPKALSAVVAAFQQNSRRKNTVGSDGLANDREIERQQEKERRQKALKRDRKATGLVTGGIDAVLGDVQKDWEELVDEEFNAVPLSLALLDSSSAGRDMESFHYTKRMLEKTLKGSVDEHYQAFANAVGHHANLLAGLTKAQGELTEARSQLVEARDALGNKHADLVQLWSRGQTLDEMMRLLDEIERLKNVPDLLESLISEKRLLQAAILLVKSMKTISKQDMLDIGAVADLRAYLITQESSLRDILIEELHSHLYLKSFWCERRWAPYTPNQTSRKSRYNTNVPIPEFDKVVHADGSKSSSRMELFLNHLTLRPTNESPAELYSSIVETSTTKASSLAPSSSTTSYLTMDPTISVAEVDSTNPESDSFTYIETLLEALSVLGKLVGALDAVIQRMPHEIFALIESTIEEVSDRSEFIRSTRGPEAGLGKSLAASSTSSYIFVERASTEELVASLRLMALEASAKESDRETLRDLFWSLFSKLDAVVQGFRVTYEVSNRIGKRRDFKDTSGAKPSSLFPLTDIWATMSSEVTVLLRDYLRDDDQLAISGRNPIASINEVLRSGIRIQDKSKSTYRFADTDSKVSAKLLKKQDEELSKVLKETVPGLITSTVTDGSNQATSGSAALLDDRAGAQHHRSLIHPDALHVTVLFQPTFAWLDRVNSRFPSTLAVSTADAQALLDDFVLDVYLPQLEEKVQSLFQDTVSAHDAFLEDPGWSTLSATPLIKAITSLVALVNSICAMMRVTPFHHENYSRLILGVIMQFYSKCSDRFQALTTRTATVPGVMAEASNFLTPAAWAQRQDLVKCLVSLNTAKPSDHEARKAFCQEETHLELSTLGINPLEASDTLGSIRSLSSLANLFQSLVWFTERLASLRTVSDDPESPTEESSAALASPSIQSPLMPKFSSPAILSDELKLPLSRSMFLRLESLLQIYSQLADIVLFTIRADIRCRAIYALQRGLRENLFTPDQEALDPDVFITELNNDLAACDEATAETLGYRERCFVFAGLPALVEHLLMSEAKQISAANALGISKMMRNITALRQGLKAIDVIDSSEADFKTAKDYYGLFGLGATGLLGLVKTQPQFTFEEYKVMLSLQSGVAPSKADDLPAGDGGDFALNLLELQTICVD
ncbi:hypothetical protein DL93DRAFT_2049947 [Clavulina sp. PMI_390]|nr:hypothetical protein DL93DRAFT_2049947 [Clavulina sp. PMI_390]